MPISSPDQAPERLREMLDASPALRFARTSRSLWLEAWNRGKPLLESQIQTLREGGNTCDDWSGLRLSGAGPLFSISHCRFEGRVILETEGGALNLLRSRFRDCKIGASDIEDVAMLDGVWVEQGARIRHVGAISGGSRFSLGKVIHPGSETGARRVYLMDGWRVEDCTRMAHLSPAAQESWDAVFQEALRGLSSTFTLIGSWARVDSVSSVEDSYVGRFSVIRGASTVRRSILASTEESPVHAGNGAIVEDCVLEPGSRVDSHGQARRSLLLEHSTVEGAGQTADSILGPNTLVAKGEVTASLLGPFVGFHHQSLLIGALWPEGCGNVAYGAMVGSNHTGRKPDQEIRPGEGTFFGLGCLIKFPANFEAAPYSLFASGVSIPPQRLAFPFSLITAALAPPRGTEGLNEILPGWMWGENAYALIRGAYKHQDRNRARRHPLPNPSIPENSPLRGTFFAAGLFAPRIAGYAAQALASLKKAGRRRKSFYLESDLPGLGKNFLTRKNLTAAITAYENHLQIFGLLEMLLEPASAKKAPGSVMAKSTAPSALLRGLSASVEAALARDSVRGGKIHPDYFTFHAEKSAEDDICRRLRQDVETLLGPLQNRLGRR